MHIQVAKWGNSLGVRIPASLAKELGLHDGSELDLQEVQGNIVLRPIRPTSRYTLEGLLEQLTPETLHEETDWGVPEGAEGW